MTVKAQNAKSSEQDRINLAHDDGTPDVVGHALVTNETDRLCSRGDDATGQDGEGRFSL